MCRVIQRGREERTCTGEKGEALWRTKMGVRVAEAVSGDARGCCGCKGVRANVRMDERGEMEEGRRERDLERRDRGRGVCMRRVLRWDGFCVG